MKPTIVVTQPIHAPVLERLLEQAEVVMNPGPHPWSPQQLNEHLRSADAMMAFMTDRIDAETLKAAPRLHAIACALKGFDNFDLVACRRAGVQLTYVPDLLTQPTAELAIGLAIAAGRHLLAGDRHVRSGEFAGWRPMLYGSGLAGATVAILGLGAVGSAIIDRLQGFGCARLLGVDPRGADPRVQSVSLESGLAQADCVFVAVPLTATSRHLINDQSLRQAKTGQVLINVGRGSVVDESAVARALDSGHLGAYAADVFECEDWLLTDRPQDISLALRQHPRTVFTPHLGSAVTQVRIAIEHRAADNLLAMLSGQPPLDPIVSS